jgi:hypothetical protein
MAQCLIKHKENFTFFFYFTPDSEIQGVLKQLYIGIPNVTVWRVLRKRLHLKANKQSIVQHLKTLIVAKLVTNFSVFIVHNSLLLSLFNLTANGVLPCDSGITKNTYNTTQQNTTQHSKETYANNKGHITHSEYNTQRVKLFV